MITTGQPLQVTLPRVLSAWPVTLTHQILRKYGRIQGNPPVWFAPRRADWHQNQTLCISQYWRSVELCGGDGTFTGEEKGLLVWIDHLFLPQPGL